MISLSLLSSSLCGGRGRVVWLYGPEGLHGERGRVVWLYGSEGLHEMRGLEGVGGGRVVWLCGSEGLHEMRGGLSDCMGQRDYMLRLVGFVAGSSGWGRV